MITVSPIYLGDNNIRIRVECSRCPRWSVSYPGTPDLRTVAWSTIRAEVKAHKARHQKKAQP